MPILLDTAGGTYARSASATSSNVTFNNVAGTFLIVGCSLNVATDEVTSITYNGVSMTRATFVLATSESDYLYYLANPATGSNTLTVNRTNNRVCDVGVASYTGVDLVSPLEQTATATLGTGAGPTITTTITPAVAGTWMFAFSGLQRISSASTNSTYRSGNFGSGGNLYDSNGSLTSGVAFSMVQSISSNGPAGAVAATFKESAGSTVNSGFFNFF